MNISDYLQALKGASNQLQTAQNLPLVREEPTPIDLSHASPMGAIGVASKSGPTQSQMLVRISLSAHPILHECQ